MGVGIVAHGGSRLVLIGTSEDNGYLRPSVLAALNPGELVIGGQYDAEQNIIDYAERYGLQVIAVGAGRPICPSCTLAIVDAGGWEAIATPTRFRFVPFWMRSIAP